MKRLGLLGRAYVLFVALNYLPAYANDEKLPPKISKCLDELVTDLLLIDRNDEGRLFAFFKQNISPYDIGSRSYGGNNWKNFSAEEKEEGLRQYFSLLMSDSGNLTAGMQNALNTLIGHRLATHPKIKAPNLHIITNIKTDAGKEAVIVVFLTPSCKVIDSFYGGANVSRFMDIATVEAAVRAQKKK